jgi:hypothetical protein
MSDTEPQFAAMARTASFACAVLVAREGASGKGLPDERRSTIERI